MWFILAASGLIGALTCFWNTRPARAVTLPIRARMIARTQSVSYRYARESLRLMDLLETGRIDETEFARRGFRLTEYHPEDWRASRKRFTED